jgi:hypothetical protein
MKSKSIVVMFRKSCTESYQYEILGMNSGISQNRYNNIAKTFSDVIVRGAKNV